MMGLGPDRRWIPAMSNFFDEALEGRVAEMVDACTRCGKCVEVCPVKTPAGVAAPAEEVISGVIDILRGGEGPAASRRWASTCMLSGECIKACPEGINPRFLLAMARLAMAKATVEPREQRRQGVEQFRKLNLDVTVQSKMQLDDDMRARLGQRVAAASRSGNSEKAPEFVFYTGCNLLKTPHIALLALDILDALGVRYEVMGGPTHCCGIGQMRTGDTAVSASMAENTMNKLARSGRVLSWCATCQVQFTETMLPPYERQTGRRPFEMTPFMRFLGDKVDDLRPMLSRPVPMRVALHRHPGLAGVVEAAIKLLEAVPGVQLVDLHQPAIGLMSNALRTLPDYKKKLQLAELEAARNAGIDALVAVYHVDHRELCAHERDWPFQVLNVLEVIGASMGLSHPDHYKRLKLMQDVDLIMADCRELLDHHGIGAETARAAVEAMLQDQPLPLQGAQSRRESAGMVATDPPHVS
jgi:heterodisulfide reductase subunit D